jgi:hypothetical protein
MIVRTFQTDICTVQYNRGAFNSRDGAFVAQKAMLSKLSILCPISSCLRSRLTGCACMVSGHVPKQQALYLPRLVQDRCYNLSHVVGHIGLMSIGCWQIYYSNLIHPNPAIERPLKEMCYSIQSHQVVC